MLHNPVVLELHKSKSLNHSPFLQGLSRTLRNLISFPFAGKTLCLTHGPSHLVAVLGARYHSSAAARVPTKPDVTSESFSTQRPRDIPISHELCYPPADKQVPGLDLWSQLLSQLTGKNKTHRISWFSIQISALTYSWMAEENPTPVAGNLSFVHLLPSETHKMQIPEPHPCS